MKLDMEIYKPPNEAALVMITAGVRNVLPFGAKENIASATLFPAD